MCEDKYNGWANWETWVTNLWATNDYTMYHLIKDTIREGDFDRAIDYAVDLANNGEGGITKWRVDRDELKESWKEEF